MIAKPKNRRATIRIVTSNSLKDARTVMECRIEKVDSSIRKRDKFTIQPNIFCE
jgi:hypothetical protein